MRQILIFTFILTLLSACSEKPNNNKSDINLVGYWRVDSVQVFLNDSLIDSNPMNYYMEISKDQLISCNAKETSPKYEIEEKSGDLYLLVKPKGEVIKSKIKILNEDQMVLIKPRKDKPEEIVHWYHSKTSKDMMERFCRGELTHPH